MNLETGRNVFEGMVRRIPATIEPKESNYKRLKRRRERRDAYLETADSVFSSIHESTKEGEMITQATPFVTLDVEGRQVRAQIVRETILDEFDIDRITSIKVEVDGDESQYTLFAVDERLSPDLPRPKRSRIIGEDGHPATDDEVLEGMLAIRFLASQLNANS